MNNKRILQAAQHKHQITPTQHTQVVYYIDHGNPTSPPRLHNPHQYYVTDGSERSKLAARPDQLGWTWGSEGVCEMVRRGVI